MSVKQHLKLAAADLLLAKDDAERTQHSKERIYKLKVLLKATVRVLKEIEQEEHDKKHRKKAS